MIDQPAGYKTERFELKNLTLFFFIAFGWTWFWWYLFIANILQMPAGVGTPDIDIKTAGPILLIVILSPFGPTIAGFTVTALTECKTGVKALWKRFWNRKLSFKWLLVILLFYPTL